MPVSADFGHVEQLGSAPRIALDGLYDVVIVSLLCARSLRLPILPGIWRYAYSVTWEHVGEEVVKNHPKIGHVGHFVVEASDRTAQCQPTVECTWVALHQFHSDEAAFGRTENVGVGGLSVGDHKLLIERVGVFDAFLHCVAILGVAGGSEGITQLASDLRDGEFCAGQVYVADGDWFTCKDVPVSPQDQPPVPLLWNTDGVDLITRAGLGDTPVRWYIGCARQCQDQHQADGRYAGHSDQYEAPSPIHLDILLPSDNSR